MVGLKRIKEVFIEIFKEHPVSETCVMAAMLSMAVECYADNLDVFSCIAGVLLAVAASALSIETFRLYKLSIGESYSFKEKKYLLPNIVLMIIGLILGTGTSVFLIYGYDLERDAFRGNELFCSCIGEWFYRITVVFVVAMCCASLYFFLKKSKLTFEKYTAKAFCGIMKTELVFFVLFIGITLIILAFSALIYDVGDEAIFSMWFILLGFVQYPCVLTGLSKTDEEISKFGKIMLNYVLPGLLSVAFVIIYVYIIKILVLWKFPSNQVFSILTTLFGFGVFIWTMAYGVCDDNTKKIFRIMPLLYIPFIVLQIMCLYMRVASYGLTVSRYAGIIIILFEILYFGLYIFDIRTKKNVMPVVFAVVTALVCISLVAPGVNAYSAVIASQKGKIECYLANPNDNDKKVHAYEAYEVLYYSCGYKGEKYIDDALDSDQIRKLEQSYYDNGGNAGGIVFIEADRYIGSLEISGDYEKLYFIDDGYSDGKIDLNNFTVKAKGFSGTVDIEELVNKLTELEAKGADSNERNALLDDGFELKDGGKVYFSHIDIEMDASEIVSISYSAYAMR